VVNDQCAAAGGGTTHQAGRQSIGDYVTVGVTAKFAAHQASGPVYVTFVGPVGNPALPSVVTPPSVSTSDPIQVGQVVVANHGTWSSPDSLSYHYSWQVCTSDSIADCATVKDTASTYTLPNRDVGDWVTVTVTATDREHQSTAATAALVGPVQAAP
jgi:hypothetical protein